MYTRLKFLNNKGFSLAEIMIAIGVAGVVAIGGAKLMSNFEKNKADMKMSTDFLSIEKSIESYLVSEDGCVGLVGKQVGEEFSLSKKTQTFGKGTELGRITVDTLRIKSFHPTNGAGTNGFIQIELDVIKDKTRKISKEMPVAVTMESGRITGCNIKQTADLMNIRNELCTKAYGLPVGMTCAQVTLYLLNAAIADVCRDAYGDKTPQYKTQGDVNLCNLDLIHAGQNCSNGYLGGFDANGIRTCLPRVSFGAGPVTPSCTDSSWSPDVSTVCTGTSLTQSSNCGNTRSVSGTKTDGSCATCTDTTWIPSQSAADVCTTAFVTETSNCGKTRSITPGTKNCSSTCRPGTSETGLGGPSMPPQCKCENKYDTWSSVTNDCADRVRIWGLGSVCFVKGTMVTMSDGSEKAIEKILKGEKVRTYNEAKTKFTVSEVARVHHKAKFSQEMYELTFADGRRLNSTDNHPYFITQLEKYLSAKEIYEKFQKGEFLSGLSVDNLKVPIIHVRQYAEVLPVFNIHVKSKYDVGNRESQIGHNYFANGILVHNKIDCGSPGPVRPKDVQCCQSAGASHSGDACDFNCEGTGEQNDKFLECMAK